MPNPRKRKGSQYERELVKDFERIGWKARKQPYSGALVSFPHDLEVEHPELGRFIVEAKRRASPHATLERWLGQANFLLIRADRGHSRVYMTWDTFAALLGVQHDS